jgi:phosphonate metabolism-associated iron-containing alcohol dehydrogenase
MSWRYHNPVDVHFGSGALAALPALTGAHSVTLVTFPEAPGLGLVERVRALLGPRLRQVIDRTEPNPDVAGLAPLYRDFWAGAGGEVTPWATVWDRGAARKYSLHLPQTWPAAVIVDPALAVSLPAGPTLAAGLDALSHALEAVWNVNANPVSDTHAVAAARLVLATLPRLMQDLGNPALREAMAQAALQAGLAFSNTKTALAHSISYDMTLRHGLPHGIACSFTLPMVLERARGADPGRDAVLAAVFDGDLRGAPALLAEFLGSLGVATRFDAYGVTAGEEARMIDNALDGVRGRNFIGAARRGLATQVP